MSKPARLEADSQDAVALLLSAETHQIILHHRQKSWTWKQEVNHSKRKKGKMIYLLQRVRQGCLPVGSMLFLSMKLEAQGFLAYVKGRVLLWTARDGFSKMGKRLVELRNGISISTGFRLPVFITPVLLLTMWPQTNALSSLSLSFLTFQMGTMIPSSYEYCVMISGMNLALGSYAVNARFASPTLGGRRKSK